MAIVDRGAKSGRRRGQPGQIDLATIGGMGLGFALVIAAMVLGGSPGAFIDAPAVLIVLGGTFAVTTTCFSLGDVVRAQSVMAKAIVRPTPSAQPAARRILRLAERARRAGVLGLQPVLDELTESAFLRKAMTLVVDGTSALDVERLLDREIEAIAQRHRDSAAIFRKAAEVSPAMGLIGTLVGLVQMLGNLDDPATIGPSMAVALLTTFYGAVLANMVFAPLASKLERNSQDELLVHQIYMIGAASISRQENPRRLEMMLNAALPPSLRVRYFD